jgi:hypothetical protein
MVKQKLGLPQLRKGWECSGVVSSPHHTPTSPKCVTPKKYYLLAAQSVGDGYPGKLSSIICSIIVEEKWNNG